MTASEGSGVSERRAHREEWDLFVRDGYTVSGVDVQLQRGEERGRKSQMYISISMQSLLLLKLPPKTLPIISLKPIKLYIDLCD
jgi:hypothetical protein